jgi:hypothetical protein
MQGMADGVIKTGGPGQEISKAWSALYGRPSQPKLAYEHAVLAVEGVAGEFFTPKDSRPSLGKVIAHLESTQALYTVGGLDSASIRSSETLLKMMKSLWTGQRRHTVQGGSVPSPPTEDEAVTAVSLAVTIVYWFKSGLVRKEP